jgi:hypothetical protein
VDPPKLGNAIVPQVAAKFIEVVMEFFGEEIK